MAKREKGDDKKKDKKKARKALEKAAKAAKRDPAAPAKVPKAPKKDGAAPAKAPKAEAAPSAAGPTPKKAAATSGKAASRPRKAEPDEIYEGPVLIRSTATGPVRMVGLRRTIGANTYEYYGMESGYRLSGSTVGSQVTRFVTRAADNPEIQTFAQFQVYATPLLPAGAKEWFEHQVWPKP